MVDPAIRAAAAALRDSSHLLVTAGAGVGVDSGLPDFRGNKGFWRAYPAYRKLGLAFEEMANPVHFEADPGLAWGFYGHRLQLYRKTVPHAGFEILRRWFARKASAFVLTSNVDGQFQKAGLADVFEIHGSIHELQCTRPCRQTSWSAEGLTLEVDEVRMRASPPFPRCPHCGALARPRILMFGDGSYVAQSPQAGASRFEAWVGSLAGGGLVVLELGAGTALPTVRRLGERLARAHAGRLVRINPREAEVDGHDVGIRLGAREALEQLAAVWEGDPDSQRVKSASD